MARKKKVMSEEERERRSIAMKAVYARKRAKKAKVREKRAYNRKVPISAVHNTLMGEEISPLPEWKTEPLEIQLKEAHATIEKLQSQLNRYRAFREVVNSLKSSMNGMINIVNSTNVIIDND